MHFWEVGSRRSINQDKVATRCSKFQSWSIRIPSLIMSTMHISFLQINLSLSYFRSILCLCCSEFSYSIKQGKVKGRISLLLFCNAFFFRNLCLNFNGKTHTIMLILFSIHWMNDTLLKILWSHFHFYKIWYANSR